MAKKYRASGKGSNPQNITKVKEYGKKGVVRKRVPFVQAIPAAHKKMPTREEIRTAVRLAREQAEAEKAAAAAPPDDGPAVEFISFNEQEVRLKQLAGKYKSMVVVNGEGGGMPLYMLGFNACQKAYGLQWHSVTSLKTRTLLSVLWDVNLRTVEQEKAETIHAICTLVRLCKMHLAGKCPRPAAGSADDSDAGSYELARIGEWRGECIPAEELNALAGQVTINNKRVVYRDVRLILDMARDQTWNIDPEDLLWLPIVNDLPVQRFDLLVVDQQLTTPCEQEFVRRSGKKVLVIQREGGVE